MTFSNVISWNKDITFPSKDKYSIDDELNVNYGRSGPKSMEIFEKREK